MAARARAGTWRNSLCPRLRSPHQELRSTWLDSSLHLYTSTAGRSSCLRTFSPHQVYAETTIAVVRQPLNVLPLTKARPTNTIQTLKPVPKSQATIDGPYVSCTYFWSLKNRKKNARNHGPKIYHITVVGLTLCSCCSCSLIIFLRPPRQLLSTDVRCCFLSTCCG